MSLLDTLKYDIVFDQLVRYVFAHVVDPSLEDFEEALDKVLRGFRYDIMEVARDFLQ